MDARARCFFAGLAFATLGACAEPATELRAGAGRVGTSTDETVAADDEGDDEEAPAPAGPSSSSGGSSSGGAASGGASSGSSSGGSSSGGSSSSGTPSNGTAGQCSVTTTGGTGGEAGGVIPVCCAPTTEEKTQIDEVFRLLNEYRVAQGRAPLTYDPELEASVQAHCLHMVEHGFFAHFAPEDAVRSPFTRAPMCGASASAENLANGQGSPEAAMTSWKNSAGHDANMLGGFARVGICHAGPYWGQLFGS